MNPATYQREKDGYPDVAVCEECGAVVDSDSGLRMSIDDSLCDACEWDLYGDEGAEE